MSRKKVGPTPPPPPPAPLTPRPATLFRRDVERLARRGEDMARLGEVLRALAGPGPLDPGLNDHALQGRWRGYRDCHVGPDWIIIYRKDATTLYLARTGTHSDLFGR